ncbi:MAG: hypothetical protein E6Q68_00870 [Polynucleobacter sp.]|nr:MAG: hypothetical protein E6Q68_00870 [Polynucleobacter sp.]
MKLLDRVDPGGDNRYYEEAFRTMLEDHMTFLRTSSNTRLETVDSQLSYIYEGDLFGLLLKMGFKRNMHWVIMRVNNLKSPFDCDDKLTTLLVPSEADLIEISSTYNNILVTED